MRSADYPLLLEPHLQERVWGGNRLGPGIGEAWDLSVHENGPCVVANGPLAGTPLPEVAAANEDDFGGPIELLAKRLDCAADLSIQVHPSDADAKTEAWVILEAEPGAGVYHGFPRPLQAAELELAARHGTLPDLMRFLEVSPGQAVFVPSGTVHAIGKGLVLFELQQSSDVTYRLYDWDRGRELHLDRGLACSNLKSIDASPTPRPGRRGALRLVECEHFHIDSLDLGSPYVVEPGKKWRAVHIIEGRARLGELELRPGQTAMLPRAAGVANLVPDPTASVLLYGP